jgi:DNA-binding HxlR family transcriptional regulator
MPRTEEARCPIMHTLDMIGGKWKITLLYQLLEGEMRYAQLRRAVDGISEKVLIASLRQLEGDGLVERQSFHEVPPRVVYRLSRRGKTLEPALAALCAWGERHARLPRVRPAAPREGEARRVVSAK